MNQEKRPRRRSGCTLAIAGPTPSSKYGPFFGSWSHSLSPFPSWLFENSSLAWPNGAVYPAWRGSRWSARRSSRTTSSASRSHTRTRTPSLSLTHTHTLSHTHTLYSGVALPPCVRPHTLPHTHTRTPSLSHTLFLFLAPTHTFWGSGPRGGLPARLHLPPGTRKVDVRLPGKGNSQSHGARPVHLIITMIK